MNGLERLINALISNSDQLVEQEIIKKFSEDGNRRIVRRFPINQAAEMIGVSRQRIYNAKADNQLTDPLFDGWVTSAGLDLYQIDKLQTIALSRLSVATRAADIKPPQRCTKHNGMR